MNNSDVHQFPLNALEISPKNVRKTDNAQIDDLLASIPVHGLIQSLCVEPHPTKKNRYQVIAGGRRLRALQELARQKRIAKDFPVGCHVYSGEEAEDVSLAENIMRLPMNPVDQFEQFVAMAERGKTVSDIAAAYCMNETIVKRRLKLGRLAPPILEALRNDEINGNQAAAYALTDDHNQQLAIFNANPDAGEWMIRRTLTQDEIPSSDKRVQFVTVETYLAEGGKARQDLFADKDTYYLTDADLLNRLYHAKIDQIIETVKAEGWKDVSYFEGAYWQISDKYKGRIYPETHLVDEAKQPRVDQIDDEIYEIQQYEEMNDDQIETVERLQAERDGYFIEDYDSNEMKDAFAFILVDHDGEPRIERGFLLKTKVKAIAQSNDDQAGEEVTNKKATLSAKLTDELKAVRTAMTANLLGKHVHLALAATVHALACNVFYGSDAVSPLQIKATRSNVHKDIPHQNLKPLQAMHEQLEQVRAALPEDHTTWFQFLLNVEYAQLGEWLAVLVASTFKAHTFASAQARIVADEIADALIVRPSDQVTLSELEVVQRCNRSTILEAVEEVHGKERADILAGMKKAEMAEVATRELDKQWLPRPLYQFATDQDKVQLHEDAEYTRRWANGNPYHAAYNAANDEGDDEE